MEKPRKGASCQGWNGLAHNCSRGSHSRSVELKNIISALGRSPEHVKTGDSQICFSNQTFPPNLPTLG